jgi:maltose O-acetyltransferase
MSLFEKVLPLLRATLGRSKIGDAALSIRRFELFVIGAAQEAKYRRECAAWGAGSRTNGRVEISDPDRANIGINVHIGHDSLLRAGGGIDIGDNTHISRECIIYSENHNYAGERLPYDETIRHRPVTIGRNVWIGIRVTILPGATIGDGAIIGAGCTVAGAVEPLSIVGAPTCQPLGARDASHYRRLEDAGRYGGKGGRAL